MEHPQPRLPIDFRTAGGMDQHHQHQLNQGQVMGLQSSQRKRKADTQETNNERLSKRLSLLNLEQDGAKLYVPVERSQLPTSTSPPNPPSPIPSSSPLPSAPPSPTALPEPMRMDNTPHKVYIYSLDDELSSSDSDSSLSVPSSPTSGGTSGRIHLLSDIDAHLRRSRIPRSVLANSDGELAGMQLVLYQEPTSLSVPQEYDGVRRAVVEARERIRERQRVELLGMGGVGAGAKDAGVKNGDVMMVERVLERPRRNSIGAPSLATIPEANVLTLAGAQDVDADAMDLD